MKKIKKVAVYPGYDNMLKDGIFDWESAAGKELRGLPVLSRYISLKKLLNERGIEIHTYDMYKTKSEIDAWLVLDITWKAYLFFLKNFISPKKIIPIMIEPRIVNPFEWNYVNFWSRLHPTILTWSPELVSKNQRFLRYYYAPFPFDKDRCEKLRSRAKKEKCLLMQSNKMSRVKGELYSLRRRIIKFFETKDKEFFDLYGYGWNSPNTRHLGSDPFYTDVYRGEAGDKWETFADYKYIFCVQNEVPAGDYEVDAFMAMAVGGVPIFLPPADAKELITDNAYINFANFKNLDELYLYLKNLSEEKYQNYRETGWEYLNSPKFKPFTVENFAENVYHAIKLHEERV